jgi:hypothetical protein
VLIPSHSISELENIFYIKFNVNSGGYPNQAGYPGGAGGLPYPTEGSMRFPGGDFGFNSNPQPGYPMPFQQPYQSQPHGFGSSQPPYPSSQPGYPPQSTGSYPSYPPQSGYSASNSSSNLYPSSQGGYPPSSSSSAAFGYPPSYPNNNPVPNYNSPAFNNQQNSSASNLFPSIYGSSSTTSTSTYTPNFVRYF